MLVVHALAVPDCGYRLWAEDTAAWPRADAHGGDDHPFAASIADLAGSFGGGSADVPTAGAAVVTVQLPSTRSGPCPSPDVAGWQVGSTARNPGSSAAEVTLRRWLVPSLAPVDAVDLGVPDGVGAAWLPSAT
nr:hypothetical protein [Micromonospora sp. DSM 115978]